MQSLNGGTEHREGASASAGTPAAATGQQVPLDGRQEIRRQAHDDDRGGRRRGGRRGGGRRRGGGSALILGCCSSCIFCACSRRRRRHLFAFRLLLDSLSFPRRRARRKGLSPVERLTPEHQHPGKRREGRSPLRGDGAPGEGHEFVQCIARRVRVRAVMMEAGADRRCCPRLPPLQGPAVEVESRRVLRGR